MTPVNVTGRGNPKQRAFLKAVEATLNVRGAARAANIGHGAHYGWMQNDPSYPARFAGAWERGILVREQKAIRRAEAQLAGAAA